MSSGKWRSSQFPLILMSVLPPDQSDPSFDAAQNRWANGSGDEADEGLQTSPSSMRIQTAVPTPTLYRRIAGFPDQPRVSSSHSARIPRCGTPLTDHRRSSDIVRRVVTHRRLLAAVSIIASVRSAAHIAGPRRAGDWLRRHLIARSSGFITVQAHYVPKPAVLAQRPSSKWRRPLTHR